MIDNLGYGSKVNRVFIHPSAVIDMGEDPADHDEARFTPRYVIESGLKRQIASIRNIYQAERLVSVASIMEKIVIGDGGYDKEEYPVTRPRPVSHLFYS